MFSRTSRFCYRIIACRGITPLFVPHKPPDSEMALSSPLCRSKRKTRLAGLNVHFVFTLDNGQLFGGVAEQLAMVHQYTLPDPVRDADRQAPHPDRFGAHCRIRRWT